MDQKCGHVKQYHEAGNQHGEVFISRMRRMDELTFGGLDEEARDKHIAAAPWG